MSSHLDPVTIASIIFTVCIATVLLRLSVCLPAFSSRRPRRLGRVRTTVIWGSGGHTAEMLLLLKGLKPEKIGPVDSVLAATDSTSFERIISAQIPVLQDTQWHRITRSREVKQSWLSTLFSSAIALWDSFFLVVKLKPQLIICNGPGTCVPICYAAFVLKLLGYCDTQIIFVESFCRVESLSLSGKLLRPIADRFVVQWPHLARGNDRVEYLGDAEPE